MAERIRVGDRLPFFLYDTPYSAGNRFRDLLDAQAPLVLVFLFGSALPIYFLNKPLHTNFYFLNNPYGNVITSTFTAWFGEKFYILGFLPAIALALVLMYAPWAAAGKKR